MTAHTKFAFIRTVKQARGRRYCREEVWRELSEIRRFSMQSGVMHSRSSYCCVSSLIHKFKRLHISYSVDMSWMDIIPKDLGNPWSDLTEADLLLLQQNSLWFSKKFSTRLPVQVLKYECTKQTIA